MRIVQHTVQLQGRFQRQFCESRRKVGTIPYRTVRMISRAEATYWIMELRLGPECSVHVRVSYRQL